MSEDVKSEEGMSLRDYTAAPISADEASPTRDELLAELAACRDVATAASGHDDSAAIADPLQVAAHVSLALSIPPEHRKAAPISAERDEIIEMCAKVADTCDGSRDNCDDDQRWIAERIAASIRALKSREVKP